MEVELNLLRKRVKTLTEERDLYKEKYDQLKTAMFPMLIIPSKYGFTDLETKILSFCISNNGLFRKDIYDRMYLDNREIPAKKSMDTMMCKIRKKIKDNDLPIVINTIWGIGYQIDKQGIEFIKQFKYKFDPIKTKRLKQIY